MVDKIGEMSGELKLKWQRVTLELQSTANGAEQNFKLKK
jgi:hypothetical protein